MNFFGVEIEAVSAWQATEDCPKPDVLFVPPMVRRRLTGVERAALAVAQAVWPADAPEEGLPLVFASRWGEIGTTAKLIRQMHEEGEMSPAGFSASVHNAAPGVFSLLKRSRAEYTAVAARERSLSAGFVEALARRRRMVFVYAEETTPELYRPDFGEVQPACAVAVRFDSSDWRWQGWPVPPDCGFDAFVAALGDITS